MSLPATLTKIVEYRGVCDLVAARVLTDNDIDGYTTGAVFAIAGVAEISKTISQASETHYYDNIPAVVIDTGLGADTLTINCSAIPLDVQAEIFNQTYLDSKGAMVEETGSANYYAIGYKTQNSDNEDVYVWRYKGKFQLGDQVNATRDDSASANGQTLTYTGIATTHKWVETGKGAKALNVEVAQNKANVSSFFSTVTTPDSLAANTSYTLTITEAQNTDVTVTRRGVELATSATIYAGDVLTIMCTGGTITVNGSSFVSGNTHTVNGAVTVVSTASSST